MLARVEGFSAETDRRLGHSSTRQATWATRTEKMLARVEGFSAETDRRLAQLNKARDLAARTEKMLARVEGFSAETDRRLAQLSNASDLATRTEKMLARFERFSAEADRQLAAITNARHLLSRDLAKAEAQSRAEAPDAPSTSSVDRLNSRRVRLGAAIAAIHKTTPRPSRRAVVAVALAVLAVVGIVATWPDGNANEVGVLSSNRGL